GLFGVVLVRPGGARAHTGAGSRPAGAGDREDREEPGDQRAHPRARLRARHRLRGGLRGLHAGRGEEMGRGDPHLRREGGIARSFSGRVDTLRSSPRKRGPRAKLTGGKTGSPPSRGRTERVERLYINEGCCVTAPVTPPPAASPAPSPRCAMA